MQMWYTHTYVSRRRVGLTRRRDKWYKPDNSCRNWLVRAAADGLSLSVLVEKRQSHSSTNNTVGMLDRACNFTVWGFIRFVLCQQHQTISSFSTARVPQALWWHCLNSKIYSKEAYSFYFAKKVPTVESCLYAHELIGRTIGNLERT